jgi:uncharacterized protein with HEPN domain
VRSDSERLADILDAAEKIRRKVAEGREAFDEDEYAQLAIVHLIQIIGEAANRLSPELITQHPEIPWRQIVATRNRVVHNYFAIDLEILWTAASSDIPELAEQISTF